MANVLIILTVFIGERRAVQQRSADASLHADVCARTAVAQEVLRPQRHLQIPGKRVEHIKFRLCLLN